MPRIARKRRGRNPRLDLSAGSWLLPPVQASLARLFLGLPIAATLLCVPRGASADDNDPSAIELRLKALETTPEKSAITRAPVASARQAIKRLLDARAAGDAAHAIELAALADDWAKLAANVLRAIELEKELATLQDRLTSVEQKRRRTEILIEATVAQRERTREELGRVKSEKSKLSQVPQPMTTQRSESPKSKAPAKAQPQVAAQKTTKAPATPAPSPSTVKP